MYTRSAITWASPTAPSRPCCFGPGRRSPSPWATAAAKVNQEAPAVPADDPTARERMLQQALQRAAPRVESTGIVERVAAKRARRRRRRQVEMAALAATLIVAL